jgi:dihydroorotate dehydrogenase (fumarate)
MADLSTTYLGLKLNNPIIIGASNFVTNEKNLKQLEEAGAGAIVYKSLFEEQIQLEKYEMEQFSSDLSNIDSEISSLFPDIKHAGPQEHLNKLKKAKTSVNIPLIASLNAVNEESWIDYAKKINETGVDALEINFYHINIDKNKQETQIINEQLNLVKKIKNVISIPLAVKISPFYTNNLAFIHNLSEAGADAVVLFNRMFQPDIDIEKEEHFAPMNFSNEEDNRLPLRYAGLLQGEIKANVCCNTGIFSGSDAIKMILAGADAVQVVSTIYKNGGSYLKTIINDLNQWMDKKSYKSIKEFKGKLANKNVKDVFTYKRAQYVDILMKSSDFFKK